MRLIPAFAPDHEYIDRQLDIELTAIQSGGVAQNERLTSNACRLQADSTPAT